MREEHLKLNVQRLREEMNRRGMKQRDLAEKAGVTEVSISRYVHGERMPKGNILAAMARALGTTSAYLLEDGAKEPPEVSYAETWTRIHVYGKDWSKEEKKKLIIKLFETM